MLTWHATSIPPMPTDTASQWNLKRVLELTNWARNGSSEISTAFQVSSGKHLGGILKCVMAASSHHSQTPWHSSFYLSGPIYLSTLFVVTMRCDSAYGTVAANGTNVNPQMIHERISSNDEMMTAKNKRGRNTAIPVALCPLQTKHKLPWKWNSLAAGNSLCYGTNNNPITLVSFPPYSVLRHFYTDDLWSQRTAFIQPNLLLRNLRMH
jgi:hypothetical protein